MAIGVYYSPVSLTTAKYNECLAELAKAGATNPAGRQYHACFGEDGSLMVYDVWESQAAFEAFGPTLMPVLQRLGIDPGQPMVANMVKVIVPPAKKAAARKPAAKKAAKPAAKKAAKKAVKKAAKKPAMKAKAKARRRR